MDPKSKTKSMTKSTSSNNSKVEETKDSILQEGDTWGTEAEGQRIMIHTCNYCMEKQAARACAVCKSCFTCSPACWNKLVEDRGCPVCDIVKGKDATEEAYTEARAKVVGDQSAELYLRKMCELHMLVDPGMVKIGMAYQAVKGCAGETFAFVGTVVGHALEFLPLAQNALAHNPEDNSENAVKDAHHMEVVRLLTTKIATRFERIAFGDLSSLESVRAILHGFVYLKIAELFQWTNTLELFPDPNRAFLTPRLLIALRMSLKSLFADLDAIRT